MADCAWVLDARYRKIWRRFSRAQLDV